MSIPRDFIDQLLAKTDIVDLINTHVPLQKKSANNYFARCPFHQEKSASFSVSQPKQFYYCFGCGASGNAIDFLINLERLPFPEAIEMLARNAGMQVPQESGGHFKKNDSLPKLYDLMIDVTKFYYDNMCKSQRAITYLKNRNITGKIAQQFKLGFAENGWSNVLDKFGTTPEKQKQLSDTGLIIKKKEGGFYDRFRDRLMFPILDYRGRHIGFGGRVIDEGEPKYLNSPETVLFQKGHELYGLYQALKSNRKLERVVIVEGYMDVIALFQHDITYAVATLGTATTENHFGRLFRYTSDIIFCFDGDKAGRTAAWRAVTTIFPIMQDNLQVRFLFLPEGEDPDSLVHSIGKNEFEKLLQKAPSLSEFFFSNLSKQCDVTTMEGRARLTSLAIGHIQELPAGIFQTILLTELSNRTRVDIDALKAQIKGEKPVAVVAAPEETMMTGKLCSPMRLVLTLLIQHPSLAETITEPLPTLSLSGYRLFQQLIEHIKQTKSASTGSLIERYRDQKVFEVISQLAHIEHMVPESGLASEFKGALKQLMQADLDASINKLLAKSAANALTPEEKQQLSEWIAKKAGDAFIAMIFQDLSV